MTTEKATLDVLLQLYEAQQESTNELIRQMSALDVSVKSFMDHNKIEHEEIRKEIREKFDQFSYLDESVKTAQNMGRIIKYTAALFLAVGAIFVSVKEFIRYMAK